MVPGTADDARCFQVSASVQPGNSGGALVDGRVVQDGDPVERQLNWKKGCWFCDSKFCDRSPNLPAD